MATLALEAGIHPKVVSERLGHSTTQLTLDTCSHVTPTMQDQASKALGGARVWQGQNWCYHLCNQPLDGGSSMPRRTTILAAVTLALILGLAVNGFAQANEFPVTLVLRDGTPVPFTVTPSTSGGTFGLPQVSYSPDASTVYGQFVANVGGTSTRIPVAQIARAELVAPREQSVWRVTLKDGRTFDGMITDQNARFWIYGINQFGAQESLSSYPRHPDRQPFIAVIFDPDAAAQGEPTAPAARADADTVALRNGDILSGTIHTDEFTVQASYGTLSFTREQLASIAIEDAAGRTDRFVLKVGDRVSGVLQNTNIEMTLTSGATITLEKGSIASITFARGD